MLEYQSLLLRPRSQHTGPDPTLGSAHDLVDPGTGRLVGVSHWQPPAARSWLSRPVLAVHEAGDEPLVFEVRQLWALTPRWKVCDADGRPVAVIRRGWVLDPFGQFLAWVDEAPPDGPRFRGRDGRELAWLSRSGEDLRLTFAGELEGEPFVKMALLAAVLSGMVGGRA